MVGCAAYGCTNRSEKGFLMKKFPKEPERRKIWTTKVRREGWTPTNTSVLCEIHFEPSMWEKTRVDGTRKLKASAVPTLFSFSFPQNQRKSRKKCTGTIIGYNTSQQEGTPEFNLEAAESSEPVKIPDVSTDKHENSEKEAEQDSTMTVLPRETRCEVQSLVAARVEWPTSPAEARVGWPTSPTEARVGWPSSSAEACVKWPTSLAGSRLEWPSRHSLCRVCGEESEDLVPIFSKLGVKLGLQDKIHNHLPIVVSEEDLLPLGVCTACTSKLEVCHELVTCCYEANTRLLALLGYDEGYSFQDEEYCSTTALAESSFTDGIKSEPEDNVQSDDENNKYNVQSDENNKDNVQSDDENNKDNVQSDDENNEEVEETNTSHDIHTQEEETYDGHDTRTQATVELPENIITDDDNNDKECQDEHDGSAQEHDGDFQSDSHDDTEDSSLDQQVELAGNEINKNELEAMVVNLPLGEGQVLGFLQVSEKTKDDASGSDEKSADVEVPKMLEDKSKKMFECMYCKEDMGGRENLILHHITAHPTKVFYCSECDVICDTQEGFNKHLTRHRIISSKVVMDPGRTESTDVNIDKSKPSVHMKVLDESQDTNNFVKSQLVIKEIVPINNKSIKKKCVNTSIKDLKCSVCQHVSQTQREYKLHRAIHPPTTFQCKVCNKQCYTKVRLSIHERVHAREKPYSCEHCGKCFNYQNTLTCHLYSHGVFAKKGRSYGKPCKCAECGNTYANKNSLRVHMKSHSKDLPYLCDICGKTMKHLSNFNAHRRLHMDPQLRNRFMCDVCGKLFQEGYRMIEHKRLHTNELPIQCSTCGKRFRTRRHLSQHTHIHVNARHHGCRVCGKRFNRRGNMISHMKRHDAHICTVCVSTFPTYSDLRHHMTISHNAEDLYDEESERSKFECVVCKKYLSSKWTLEHHMRIHSGERPFACNVCDKKFTVKNSLSYHLLTHKEKRPFECRFCHKGFLTKWTLIDHERYHTGEKPFICEVCGKSFRLKINLTQHRVVHSDEYPFKCPHCNKVFRRRDARNIHVRIHTGEKPYQCKVCEMEFRSKMNLNQHLIVHSDYRPFPCPQCGRRFRRRDYLEGHLRIHTGERPYPCKICGRRFRQKGDCTKHEKGHSKVKQEVKQEAKQEAREIEYHIPSAHTSDVDEPEAIVVMTVIDDESNKGFKHIETS